MGRHKRLRKMTILVILIICGVLVWNRSGISERYVADAASGERVTNTLKEGNGSLVDDEGNTMTVPEGQAEEDKKAEMIVSWMIERIADGEVELSDETSIRQAFDEAEEEFHFSLTADSEDRVVGFLQTLGNIGEETEDFIEQAKEKYRQYSTRLVEETNAAIGEAVESAASSAARSFFESMKESVEDFVLQLVPGSSGENID